MNTWVTLWSIFWIIAGGALFPIYFSQRGRNPLLGAIIGSLAGALGGALIRLLDFDRLAATITTNLADLWGDGGTPSPLITHSADWLAMLAAVTLGGIGLGFCGWYFRSETGETDSQLRAHWQRIERIWVYYIIPAFSLIAAVIILVKYSTPTASAVGLVVGAIFGLIPLAIALHNHTLRPGSYGFAACLLSAFSCGFWGGLPVIVFAIAVVLSYTYTSKDDPFLSRAAIEEVDFSETFAQWVNRRLATLGRTTRVSTRALVRNKAGFLGFLGLLFFFVLTVFGPSLIEYDGSPHYYDRLRPGAINLFRPPSWEFPLGLDWQGRDILSHIVHGGRPLIITAVEAGVMTTGIAVVFGATAALVGGVIDRLLNALANFILTIPQFPLLVVLAGLIDFKSRFFLAVLLAVLDWPTLMRSVRAQVLSLRERDYVEAAVALDLGLPHIIGREILPQIISYVVIFMIFSTRSAMYQIVGLVFLGMVPFTEPDWGVMIYMGRSQGALFSSSAVSQILSPVLAVALFQLSLVLFTRSLEEVFNPRLRAGL